MLWWMKTVMKVSALAEPAQIEVTDLISSVRWYRANKREKCLYVLILKRKDGGAVDELDGLGVTENSLSALQRPKSMIADLHGTTGA